MIQVLLLLLTENNKKAVKQLINILKKNFQQVYPQKIIIPFINGKEKLRRLMRW